MSSIIVNRVSSVLDLSDPKIAKVDLVSDETNLEICTKIIYRKCSQTRREIDSKGFTDLCPSFIVQSIIYYAEFHLNQGLWEVQHEHKELLFLTYSFCKEYFKQILVGEYSAVDIELQRYGQLLLDHLEEDSQSDSSYVAFLHEDQKLKIVQELLKKLAKE